MITNLSQGRSHIRSVSLSRQPPRYFKAKLSGRCGCNPRPVSRAGVRPKDDLHTLQAQRLLQQMRTNPHITISKKQASLIFHHSHIAYHNLLCVPLRSLRLNLFAFFAPLRFPQQNLPSTPQNYYAHFPKSKPQHKKILNYFSDYQSVMAISLPP